MGLGWGVARNPNCTHRDPPAVFFHTCIEKGSKQALAAGVTDILKAWKKWKISCVVGAKDYLGLADVHGLRTQQSSEAVGPCTLCMGV